MIENRPSTVRRFLPDPVLGDLGSSYLDAGLRPILRPPALRTLHLILRSLFQRLADLPHQCLPRKRLLQKEALL
jgi:hypothetical protein